MFTLGFKKTAATSLKNYITAIANREIRIADALKRLSKGKLKPTIEHSPYGKMLKGKIHESHTLSQEMADLAKKKGIDPESSARLAKTTRLARLGEHAEHLQKTTRPKQIRKSLLGEQKSFEKKKTEMFAERWDNLMSSLRKAKQEKLKKPKAAKKVKKGKK